MKVDFVEYEDIGMLHPITRAYINNDPKIQSLFQYAPSAKGLKEAIDNRNKFPVDRSLLVKQLREQYAGSESKIVDETLSELEQDNCFTVVTGHQLCLFTGPLYFIYKIFSAINLARDLRELYPEKRFVPVYWMATEDHDFDEINHFHLEGKTIRWNKESNSAVGRLKLDGMDQVIQEVQDHLGDSLHACQAWEPFVQAYQQGKNLADATRKLVHALFPHDGLICVDGDDRELKRVFIPAIEKELFEQVSENSVQSTIETWKELGYKEQVGGRELNLFYLTDEFRNRIVKTETGFQVVDTDIHFTDSEIREEYTNYPERFSPNVLLRPVYQEMILPNLAYIGGGAEVAYWLQLKSTFESLNVFYPVVLLRNSFAFLNDKEVRKMNQLQLSATQIFQSADELLKLKVQEDSDSEPFFEDKKKEIQSLFTEINEKLASVDSNLGKSAKAAEVDQLNRMDSLLKKLIRTEKKQAHVTQERIAAVKALLEPDGKVQERYWNILQLLMIFGWPLMVELRKHSDVLDFRMKLMYP